eukprot:CAMPEP_0171366710 /NCGR_PEP_ID=MMETSP0879-20121228/5574_1 /TAXON_ID=67004 /ORGANISM="Thalassiosira weissflogii, Strain CCMP1336" /LENGTH=286 /DNA_ID=CAMNT_0011874567 /DNA_START=60 /DNA_END=920 /DNA_ORIENTATION=+
MSYSTDSDGSIQLLDKMHYPRTGKRGVPQQFPRRLYEMLEAESASGSTSPSSTSLSSNDDSKSDLVVHWSTSGRAFRIVDVTLFSNIILPKYFKTSKFSSFQRNLNLYGFTKVRKGPDVDMYFHPKFVRGDVDGLSKLRKRTSAVSDKKINEASTLCVRKHDKKFSPLVPPSAIRTVSPMSSHFPRANSHFQQYPTTRYAGAPAKRYIHELHNSSPLMPVQNIPSPSISSEEEASLISASSSDNDSIATMIPPARNQGAPFPNLSPANNPRIGRLDLLAEAMRMVI